MDVLLYLSFASFYQQSVILQLFFIVFLFIWLSSSTEHLLV